MSPWKIVEIKIDEMKINFHTDNSAGAFHEWFKMWRNVLSSQQISSRYQTLSTAVFATTLFVTKIMGCCVTHDATSSKLLNSTNEANAFLTMYNIIRFSRLPKLVSSNLNVADPDCCQQMWSLMVSKTLFLTQSTFGGLMLSKSQASL